MSEEQSRLRRLEQDGWTRRFTSSESRLSEMVDMYREAGFEVHCGPMPKEIDCKDCTSGRDEEGDCRVCFEGFEDQYRILFTRLSGESPEPEEDLF